MKHSIKLLLVIILPALFLSGCSAVNIQTQITANNDNSSDCPKTVKYDGGAYDQGGGNGIFGGYYRTVKIGTQCWLKDNLNVGTMIKGTIDQSDNKIIEKYCYDNNSGGCDANGGLYQWDEAMQYYGSSSVNFDNSGNPLKNVQGICPSGWHIPNDVDWKAMIKYLGGDDVAGDKLKAASVWGDKANNSSGFSALPSGQFFGERGFVAMYGKFFLQGSGAVFWSSSYNSRWTLLKDDSKFDLGNKISTHGLSIRCIKD
ncbi:MAG: FISUMP domain-containing protein [Candidatus Falkowbacteria bacterium]